MPKTGIYYLENNNHFQLNLTSATNLFLRVCVCVCVYTGTCSLYVCVYMCIYVCVYIYIYISFLKNRSPVTCLRKGF